MSKLINKNKFLSVMHFVKNSFYTIFLYVFYTTNAIAQPSTNASNPGSLQNPLGTQSLSDFFDGIIGVAIQLGVVVSGLSIMYGGFLYVTAMGDEEKITKAYKTMTWSLVGTAVLLGAHVIMLAIRGTIEQLN